MTQEPKIFPYIASLLQGTEVVWKPLGEVASLKRGRVISKEYLYDNVGEYPVYSSQTVNNGEIGRIKTFDFEQEAITWTTDGANAGTVFYREGCFSITNVCGLVTIKNIQTLNYKYLYYWLSIEAKKHVYSGMGNPKLMSNQMEKIQIPLPPLSVQQEIVSILDKFTQLEAELEAELDCRKRQYEYYRNNLLFYEGNEVEWKTLDQISENLDSKRQPITSGLRTSGKIPYYGASGIVDYVEDYIFDGDFLLISEDGANLLARNTPIAFSVSGKIWVNNHAHILKFRTYEERRFIEFYLNKTDLTPYISGAAQPKLNKKNLNSIKIPIPPLEEQQRIITILDKFDTLVNSISEGLPKEIALRRKQYEYYREKLLSFPKE